jgi:hypothetical protein
MSQDPAIKVGIKGLQHILSKKPIPLLEQLLITKLKLFSVVKHKAIKGTLLGFATRVLIEFRGVL